MFLVKSLQNWYSIALIPNAWGDHRNFKKQFKNIGGGGGGGGVHLNYHENLIFLKCRFHEASLCCLGAYGKICCAQPIVQKHILPL